MGSARGPSTVHREEPWNLILQIISHMQGSVMQTESWAWRKMKELRIGPEAMVGGKSEGCFFKPQE